MKQSNRKACGLLPAVFFYYGILAQAERVTTVTPPLIRTLHNRSSQSQPRRRLRKRRTEARHVAVSGSSSVVDPKDVTVAFPDKNINASLPRSEALHNAAISPCTTCTVDKVRAEAYIVNADASLTPTLNEGQIASIVVGLCCFVFFATMSCIYLLKRSQKVRTWRGRSSITPSVIAGETAATSSKLDHPCPKSVSSLQNNDSHILNIIKSYNRMPGSQNTLEAIADVAAASYWPLPPSPTFDGQSPSRHYSCDSIHSDLSFLKASQAFLSMYGQPLSMLDTSSLVNTRFSDLAQRLSKMSTKSPPVKSGKYQGADNPLAPLPFSVLGEGTQETQINSHRTLYHDWQDKTALPSYDHAEDSPLSINKNTGRLHRWPSQRGSSSPIGLPPSTPPPAPPFLL